MSIEEKLSGSGRFGFPVAETPPSAPVQEPEPAEPQTEPESDSAEVEWDGAKYTIPSVLKDALMRNEDYTRKTQELAEQRRVLDQNRELMTRGAIESRFMESVADETRQLAVIDAYLTQVKAINWAGMSMDQMMKTKIEIDGIKEQRAEIEKSIAGKRGKFQEEMTQKLSELKRQSRELAAKSIPNYSEETEKSIRAYAASEGLTDQEIDNVLLDPRSAKVLWKASQYDKVKAGTVKATESARAVRPGAASNPMPPEVRANLDYRKAMQKAVTSRDREKLIEQKLASNSVFNRGNK
jgi:hypothetical protein